MLQGSHKREEKCIALDFGLWAYLGRLGIPSNLPMAIVLFPNSDRSKLALILCSPERFSLDPQMQHASAACRAKEFPVKDFPQVGSMLAGQESRRISGRENRKTAFFTASAKLLGMAEESKRARSADAVSL